MRISAVAPLVLSSSDTFCSASRYSTALCQISFVRGFSLQVHSEWVERSVDLHNCPSSFTLSSYPFYIMSFVCLIILLSLLLNVLPAFSSEDESLYSFVNIYHFSDLVLVRVPPHAPIHLGSLDYNTLILIKP